MLVAGTVNMALLLVAATNLRGRNIDTIEGPTVPSAPNWGHRGSSVRHRSASPPPASTSVGAYAGAMIMQGLLRRTFAAASPVGDAGARAGGVDKRDRPHLRPRVVPGRAIFRHPVRADPAGG